MMYARVNGLQLYYEIRDSGKPLVLLHCGLAAPRRCRGAATAQLCRIGTALATG